MTARRRLGAVLIAAALAAVVGGADARAAAVTQLVVFRDGDGVAKRAATGATTVRVGRRECAVAAATPLAALVRSRVGALGLKDYGSCSARPRDATSLFVRSIRGERNRGQNGWVYKVGRRAGSAGAADPSGPFGAGRLRSDARVTWFYCLMQTGGCQRTLEASATAEAGAVVARVTGYDDRGAGVAIAGATVHVGGTEALTGLDGSVRVATAAGRQRVWAENAGMVRSFTETVSVP